MKKLLALSVLAISIMISGCSNKMMPVANVGEVYTLSIFGRSINDLVQQGNYGWANPNITDQNFKLDEMHQCEIVMKHFSKEMSTDAVLKALDEKGLRPATISELLEFGSRYPEVQKQFPIVALGSAHQVPVGLRFVGALSFKDGQRGLSLRWLGDDWNNVDRFAAVRK